jgi:hypothetical protein
LGKSQTDIGIFVLKVTLNNLGKITSRNIESFTLKPPKIKLIKNEKNQIADPFLVEYDGDIWLFYEEKRIKQKGDIKARCLTKEGLGIYNIDLDIINKTHLSYPNVFWDKQSIYMIPETAEIREIGLYKCKTFPSSWVKLKSLLTGNFVDSSVHEENGVYYLFTTEKVFDGVRYDYILKLFCAHSLLDDFTEHPCSPIKNGKRYGRSGGSILKIGNLMFRFSQDCSDSYGRELIQFQITKLNLNEYEEIIICDNWIKANIGHQAGGHHCSVVQIDSTSIFVAVDLNHPESYLQRFINKVLY